MVDLRKKLRSGMIAVTRRERYLILTDCETKYYGRQKLCLINSAGFMVGTNYKEDLSSGSYTINALYKPTVDSATYRMKIKNQDLIWARYPTNLKELIISRRFSE